MTAPLLTTKLYVPPPQPNLVPRPRLIQRLEGGLHQGQRLTLVSAPAGFGKTTLLSAWVAGRRERVAWLSLDADDNEPPRFWTYLIAALQTVQGRVGSDAAPALGQEALQLFQVPNPPSIETILTRLLNEIAALPDEIILVMDDYHVISTQEIQEGLAFLLAHHPPPLHLVISTRADPPLPIVRLRARGQLTELRADELRFTPQETASFLNELMGLDLLPEDIAALEARTEGWVVGLRLAGLSMQGRTDPRAFIRAFTGSHHYVLEYLTQEVLNRQSEATRRFLDETSILGRLCGPLCDAVTGDQDGAATLARLHRDNLFTVPLDEAHHWYRYHHLFADLLGNL